MIDVPKLSKRIGKLLEQPGALRSATPPFYVASHRGSVRLAVPDDHDIVKPSGLKAACGYSDVLFASDGFGQ